MPAGASVVGQLNRPAPRSRRPETLGRDGTQDWNVSFYREHGHILARGTDPKAVMAELFGREGGVAHGRGGSMHLFDAGRRFMGGYGIVAGQMPLALGVGYSTKYRRVDEITL